LKTRIGFTTFALGLLFWGSILLTPLFPISSFSLTITGNQANLKVTSFNIRWYGNGGSFRPKEEQRDQDLKHFFDTELKDSDLIMFQEIVDVVRLQNIFGTSRECTSYDHPDPNHQHVVVCVNGDILFGLEPGFQNHALEDLALTRYRPGLHGLVQAKSDRRALLHMIGVHLKAHPNHSKTRYTQGNILADRIDSIQLKIIYL